MRRYAIKIEVCKRNVLSACRGERCERSERSTVVGMWIGSRVL